MWMLGRDQFHELVLVQSGAIGASSRRYCPRVLDTILVEGNSQPRVGGDRSGSPERCNGPRATLRMLKEILDAAKLDAGFCASLVGVSAGRFHEWIDGKRPLPSYVIPELSSILGVSEHALTSPKSDSQSEGMIAPAIWFKLRDEKLTPADRELVGVIRKIGYFLEQLRLEATSAKENYKELFTKIRLAVDKSAPPAVQGRSAASAFRDLVGFQHQQRGVGELIRPQLSRLGVLIVESPLPKSPVEGCSFQVGYDGSPCLFANSYKSTWFRRNAVILHELAHSLFDLDNEQVSIDYREQQPSQLLEIRAESFAQEVLVSEGVLSQITNRYGLDWSNLSVNDLARPQLLIHMQNKG